MNFELEPDDGPRPTINTHLVGIEGWLILPAIGFILGPIVGIVMLLLDFSDYEKVAAKGFGVVFALELVVQFILIIFLIYTATRFFGMKRDAPITIIILLILELVLSGVLLVIEENAGAH